jgi:hypothetical protein
MDIKILGATDTINNGTTTEERCLYPDQELSGMS